MINQKFIQLIHLKSCLDQFNAQNACDFIQDLFTNNRQDIISNGIFHQLYRLGDSIDAQLIDQLLTKARDILVSSSSDKVKCDSNSKSSQLSLTDLPCDVVSIIGSCLSCQEILTSWNHVNRTFLEIGYTPGTIREWEFDSKCSGRLCKHPPKFKLDSLINTVEKLAYNCDYRGLFNASNAKSFKNILIGMFCVRLCASCDCDPSQ